MNHWTLHYEHDDALIARAVRELVLGRGLRRALAWWAAFALGSAALLLWFESLPGAAPAPAMRLIMLLPAVVLALALLAIPLVLRLVPWWLARRMRRLPHRRVTVVLDDSGVEFATAHERYRVAWSEVRSIAQRQTFWDVRTQSGARLALPVAAVPAQAQAWLAARATSNGPT